MTTLYYVLDPMCSWCYGFAPTWNKVLDNLSSDIKVVYVQGGLAPKSDEAMAQDMQNMLQGIWKQIHEQLGTKFNHEFWTKCHPRRSTYLACQACVAARLQGKEYEMIQAIQELYYLKASNPSDRNTLETAARNIGLDMEKFSSNLESKEIISLFEEDLNKRRKLKMNSFPSLVFKYKNNYFPINITYNNPEAILKQVEDLNQNIYF